MTTCLLYWDRANTCDAPRTTGWSDFETCDFGRTQFGSMDEQLGTKFTIIIISRKQTSSKNQYWRSLDFSDEPQPSSAHPQTRLRQSETRYPAPTKTTTSLGNRVPVDIPSCSPCDGTLRTEY